MRFYFDPGHGWLAVPVEKVKQAGIQVSSCSYIDRTLGIVYLEEDCDATAYVEATGEGREVEEIGLGDYCFIRQLPHVEAHNLGE